MLDWGGLLSQYDWCFYEKNKKDTDTYATVQAESELVHLQKASIPRVPGNHQKMEKARKNSSLEPSERTQPC